MNRMHLWIGIIALNWNWWSHIKNTRWSSSIIIRVLFWWIVLK
jgi:hypothetical protein